MALARDKKRETVEATQDKASSVLSVFKNQETIKEKDFSKLRKTSKSISCRFKFKKVEEIEEVANRAGLDRSDVIKIAVYKLLDEIKKNKLELGELIKIKYE